MKFIEDVNQISKKIFIPITLGGSINSMNDVHFYLKNGADKILLNNMFFENINLVNNIAQHFGKQFIIGCIDYKFINNEIKIYKKRSKEICTDITLNEHINKVIENGAGEIMLQSIDFDGTGMGIDLKIVEEIKKLDVTCPIILKGGIGKPEHIKEILLNKSECHLHSKFVQFYCNTFNMTRSILHKENIDLANWNTDEISKLKNCFK